MPSTTILSIQVGMPKIYSHPQSSDEDRQWSSGIFKNETPGPVYVGRTNLEGDGQADLEHHGGGDRAVLIFSRQNYPMWETELGVKLPGGAFGENLTVDSVTEDDVCLGDIWASKDVKLEVSQPRLPCYKLSRRLGSEGLHLKVMEAHAAGWYCRTLQEGHLQAGETLTLVSRPHPEWTIRRAFREFVFVKDNEDALALLGTLPSLSKLWSERIEVRLAKASSQT